MANIPKKMQDPTDGALTAIQEVLNSADNPAEDRSGTPAEAPQVPTDTIPRRARGLTPAPETDLFDERSGEPSRIVFLSSPITVRLPSLTLRPGKPDTTM